MTVRTTGDWAGANHVQVICHTESKFVVSPNMLEQYGRTTIEKLAARHDSKHDVEIILKNRVRGGEYKPT